MKNIGEELRLKREELGISLEEISNRIKIPVERLKAIEDGDMEHFNNDISYLRYFVRFYCQALGLHFDDYRDRLTDAIDDYSDTLSLRRIEAQKKMEQSIQQTADFHNKGTKPAKKIDFSFLSMAIIIVVLFISLAFVFFMYVLPELKNPNKPPIQSDPIVDTRPKDEEKPVVDNEPAKTVITIDKIDSRTYAIGGWTENDNIAIDVKFGVDTWVKVYYDGIATDNPASKIYSAGTDVEILYAAQDNGEIILHLGCVKGNSVTVNDTPVEWDPEIADWTTGLKIKFILKGAQHESAQ